MANYYYSETRDLRCRLKGSSKDFEDVETLFKKYDEYKKGNLPQEDYVMFILSRCSDFIWDKIQESIPADRQEDRDDAYMTAIAEITTHIDSYDPHKNDHPIGFFNPFIKHEVVKSVKKESMTSYYNQRRRKLLGAAQTLGFNSLQDVNKGEDVVRLKELTQMSMKTIQQILQRETYSICSYDLFDDNIEESSLSAYVVAPETIAIENMMREQLQAELDKLPEHEAYFVRRAIFDGMSANHIYRHMETAENGRLKARFEDALGAPITISNINYYTQVGINRIKASDFIKGMLGAEKTQNEVDFEPRVQASIEDIKDITWEFDGPFNPTNDAA